MSCTSTVSVPVFSLARCSILFCSAKCYKAIRGSGDQGGYGYM